LYPLPNWRSPLRKDLERLTQEVLEAKEKLVGLRKGTLVDDAFERVGYLTAKNFKVLNYPRDPLVAFNPSAVVKDGRVFMFTRFIFDYYGYVSSIGLSTFELEKLENACCLNLSARLVIYPTTVHEVKRGAEDPRAHLYGDGFLVFYTAVGLKDGDLWPKQGVAVLDENGEVVEKSVLRLGDVFPPSWKNTTMIRPEGRGLVILTRPWIEGHEVIWRATVDAEEWVVDPSTMRVTLVPERFELKVGVSTTPVKIGSDEYLIGWHAIMKDDLSYRNGLAVVNGDGELLGISEYLLYPKYIEELYGDRPMVIYGCGLVKHKEYIYWIGGVADYGIGIYRAPLDKVMEHIKWLR